MKSREATQHTPTKPDAARPSAIDHDGASAGLAAGSVHPRRKIRQSKRAQWASSQNAHLVHRGKVPVLHSDSLASVTFAPDQLLLTLSLAGVVGSTYSLWVGGIVALVLAVVVASYRQTLKAYPRGGDYAVVKKNLGSEWGLLVGSALLVDSVLLTAIMLSAAAQFLTALFPILEGQQPLFACLLVVILGVGTFTAPLKDAQSSHQSKSSKMLASAPSYLFLLALLLLICVGALQWMFGILDEAPSAAFSLSARPQYADGLVGVGGVYLFARAFASGATSLSGVSAISNGVATFPKPQATNAVRSLSVLAASSVLMTLAILWLARLTHMQLVDDPTRLIGGSAVVYVEPMAFVPAVAQLAHTVYGERSIMFVITLILSAGMLVTAAVIVYRAFPTLVGTLAQDSFLPRQLHVRSDGRRSIAGLLLFTTGIMAFIIVFNAQPARLIHLYIVGLFLALTLSQLGMIRHWNRALRTRQTGQERSGVIRVRALNIVGFLMTATALLVVLGTKFAYGVWVSVLLIALLFAVQRAIHHYYTEVARHMALDTAAISRAMPTRVHAIVVTPSFTQLTELTVATARATAPSSLELLAVVASDEDEKRIRRGWEASGISAPLTLLSSPTRQITPTIVEHVEALRLRRPQELVMVYVPHMVVKHWWLSFMHNQSGKALRRALMHIPGVVVTLVPWHLGVAEHPFSASMNNPYRGLDDNAVEPVRGEDS